MRTINASVDIDVDDIIGDIDTQDLIDELKSRKENVSDLIEHKKMLYKLCKVDSVQDAIKIDAIIKCYKDIPESDLDQFLSRFQ